MPLSDIRGFNVRTSTSNKTKICSYQLKHARLVWSTLNEFFPADANKMLEWIKIKLPEIFLFCFSRGLAKDNEYWADIVWYINMLGLSEEGQIDKLFSIKKIALQLRKPAYAAQVRPGTINGGSTIQLPYGFVQWHQHQMQFHHSLISFGQFSSI